MLDQELLEEVEEEAKKTARNYKEKYNEPVPVKSEEVNQYLEEGVEASLEEVEKNLEDLIVFYDEILDTDSTKFKDQLEDGLRYDTSWKQILKDSKNPTTIESTKVGTVLGGLGVLTGAAPLAALPLAGLTGGGLGVLNSVQAQNSSYNKTNNTIGVSRDPIDRSKALHILSKEVYHALQDKHGSDTWNNFFLHEGSEEAISHYAFKEFSDDQKAADALKTRLMLTGVKQLDDLVDGYDFNLYDDFDLSKSEVEELEDEADKLSNRYGVGGAVLKTLEESEGGDIYKRVFDGDHQVYSFFEDLENELRYSERTLDLARRHFPFK